ncbi:MAG TPA: hypothetical protein VHB46_01855 [Burkholderiales bacterium]|nr:hypothetical protein [Burkholderiales bacterium]
MAARTKRKGKSASRTKAAAKAAPAKHAGDAAGLKAVIEALIDAKRSGDHRASAKATAELGKFQREKGSGLVQQAANEAHAVAGHAIMVDSLRLLGGIASRLG